jgi:hypothetical protein
MLTQEDSARFTGKNRRRAVHITLLMAGTLSLLATGCEEEARSVAKRPQTRALDQTGATVGAGDPTQGRVQNRTPAVQSRPIIGQQMVDIRNATKELQTGGAQVGSTKIVARDYITLQGNAYVAIIGQTSILKIQHAMDLFHAANDRYPKDYDEFRAEIIKVNSIALPQLPPYQKYAYDEKAHKLIILEYQEIKNQPGPR